MSKKKICLVIASPLTVKFFHLDQIAALAKEYDLAVITNTDTPEFLAHLEVPVRVIPVPIERNVHLWNDLRALIRLIYIFSRERFELVHSQSPKSGLLGMAAAWFARVPVRIHTFQGEVWITRKGLWRAFLKFMDKLIAKWATHLLVVSPSEERFLIDQGIIPQGKSQILAKGSVCGVDTTRFKPDAQARSEIRASLGIPESDPVILYLGRLTVDKGLLDLATAYSRVRAHHGRAHLLFVGPDEENMRARITETCSDISAHLHFVGYTSEPERYMAASDMLCLPSYREGFGLVLIEAAATGLPTIGSRIYGITDAIQESRTGLLFEPGDTNDLAEKLDMLLGDAALREKLGKAGCDRVHRDFSAELVLSELFKFYEQCLSIRQDGLTK